MNSIADVIRSAAGYSYKDLMDAFESHKGTMVNLEKSIKAVANPQEDEMDMKKVHNLTVALKVFDKAVEQNAL